MTEVIKAYYPDGTLRITGTLVDGVPHREFRQWHPNGTLSELTTYKNGVPDGTSYHWNSEGNLLGTYTITDGTGTQVMWNDDGSIAAEFDFVDGKWNGLHRFYLNGELTAQEFYINNSKTTKRKYLQQCEVNPKLPKYVERQPSKQTAAPRTSPPLATQSSAMCQKLFDHLLNGPEARSWLSDGDSNRSLGESRDQESSLDIVNELYLAGATNVLVADITKYDENSENASILVVHLPKNTKLRSQVLATAHEVGEAGFDAETDVGQAYIVVKLD